MKASTDKSAKNIIKPWKVERSRYVLEDRWIKVRADDCVTEEGVVITPYYVLEYPDWVHMVVINNEGQVLITEQYRHGAGKVGYELVCGTVEQKDKDSLEAAKRELLEETGYEGDFSLAGVVSPNPANHANKIFVYLVTNPVQRCLPEENPTEVMNHQFIDKDKVWALVDSGEFQQALQISSLVLGLRKMDKGLKI